MAKATRNKKVNSKEIDWKAKYLEMIRLNIESLKAMELDWKIKYTEEVILHNKSLRELDNLREKLEAIKRGDLQAEGRNKVLH